MHTHSTSPSLVIHKICARPDAPPQLELRQEEMPASAVTAQLVEQLYSLYAGKLGKGYGKFEEDEVAFPLPRLLRECVQAGTLGFLALTTQMMHNLLARMGEDAPAEDMYVLFARLHHHDDADFLLVALVPEARGMAITPGLEMVERPYLDVANLRAAGQIDLAAWQKGLGRYISFLKGRAKVADYFKGFLGCNDVVAPLKETQKLIKGIEHFAETQKLEAPERDQLYEQAHQYLEELGENDLPWEVSTVAAKLAPAAPEVMRTALAETKLDLREGCVPDRRAIRPLLKVKGAAANWKIEFNRSGLHSGDVVYSRSQNTLTLHNLPEKLKRALQIEPDSDVEG